MGSYAVIFLNPKYINENSVKNLFDCIHNSPYKNFDSLKSAEIFYSRSTFAGARVYGEINEKSLITKVFFYEIYLILN